MLHVEMNLHSSLSVRAVIWRSVFVSYGKVVVSEDMASVKINKLGLTDSVNTYQRIRRP